MLYSFSSLLYHLIPYVDIYLYEHLPFLYSALNGSLRVHKAFVNIQSIARENAFAYDATLEEFAAFERAVLALSAVERTIFFTVS